MLNVDDWQETAVGAKQLEAHLEKRRQNGEPSELSDRSNSDLYMIQAKSINDTSTTDQLTFMVKIDQQDQYIFLRLPFKAVDGDLDQRGVSVELGQPFLLAHEYQSGIDNDDKC